MSGSLFQFFGPATENAISPQVAVLVFGIASNSLVPEHKKHFSAIGRSSAIVSDYTETLFSDRARDCKRSYASSDSSDPAIVSDQTKTRLYSRD